MYYKITTKRILFGHVVIIVQLTTHFFGKKYHWSQFVMSGLHNKIHSTDHFQFLQEIIVRLDHIFSAQ
jgi:hypothetical protein